MLAITTTNIILDTTEESLQDMAAKITPGITKNGELDFGQAFHFLKMGWKIARQSWNNPNQYVTKILPGNAMHQGYPMQPCLGLRNANYEMQPGWVPSQGDLFANDWYALDERKEHTF